MDGGSGRGEWGKGGWKGGAENVLSEETGKRRDKARKGEGERKTANET